MSGDLAKAGEATDKIVEAIAECLARVCDTHDYDLRVMSLNVLHAYVDDLTHDESIADAVLQLIEKAKTPVTDDTLLDGYENDEQSVTDEVVADDKEREDDTTDA